MNLDRCQAKTITDFGNQWKIYRDNEGFFGSLKLFWDMFDPLLKPEDLKGSHVAEIGSGAGRIVNMLLQAGASHVIALEPSVEAMEITRENTSEHRDQITYLQVSGEQLPASRDLDYVFSVGVIHHIPDPAPVMKAAYDALRPGGKVALWLYGREGNGLYLAVIKPLRIIAKRLPHSLLAVLSWCLYWPLLFYIGLCRMIPLPLQKYMTEVIGPMSPQKRRLVIYDQLNPAYAKYYKKSEAYDLVANAGFENIKIYHRHGYSWTVVGTKP